MINSEQECVQEALFLYLFTTSPGQKAVISHYSDQGQKRVNYTWINLFISGECLGYRRHAPSLSMSHKTLSHELKWELDFPHFLPTGCKPSLFLHCGTSSSTVLAKRYPVELPGHEFQIALEQKCQGNSTLFEMHSSRRMESRFLLLQSLLPTVGLFSCS